MFLEKLELLNNQFQKIEKELSTSTTTLSKEKYKELVKQYSYLRQFSKKYVQYLKLLNDIEDIEKLKKSQENEIKEMAFLEYYELIKKQNKMKSEIEILLIPTDQNENKNIIMEIRAGTGGNEAALFVGDLYRMYIRFSEKNKWNHEILSSNSIGLGGYKEIIFEIRGNKVWRYFKFEIGTHRVQRIPETETNGRIHTSVATVAVLPEAEEIEVEIKTGDLRIDTYRSSGAGGQHVNKTDSAIRITHLPTNIVVSCQDERSQLKNKEKAFKILRAKLYEQKIIEQEKQFSSERKKQIGSGDRSEKIRTYNFQQNRITDHRILYSVYNIMEIMNGNLSELVNKLIEADIELKLKRNST
jgi:peptide chain release factor 1